MACSGVGGRATTTAATSNPPTPVASADVTTPPTSPTATTNAPITTTSFDPGDLAGWEFIDVTLGETPLRLALADDVAERTRGLMGVDDFGDLHGMLFAYEEDTMTSFWMKDTPLALDIAFFDMTGALVDDLTMPPCTADPCPFYVPSGPFTWAIESPAGALARPGADDRLVVGVSASG